MQRVQLNGGSSGPNGTTHSKKTKPAQLEYFGVQLPVPRVNSILNAMFSDADPDTARFYRQLSGTKRIQAEFHCTLIHRASASGANERYWKKLSDLFWNKAGTEPGVAPPTLPELARCQVQLERVVWDNRVMCFVVRLVGDPIDVPDGKLEFTSVNPVAHVTVGTASKDIKPVESNGLLQRWLNEGSGQGVQEMMVKGSVVLGGTVKGVLSR